MSYHPKTNFSRIKPADALTLGGRLISMLYDVLAFNNPSATPPVVPPVSKITLTDAVKLLSDRNIVAFKGGKYATRSRNDALAALILLFYELAKHVDLYAKGIIEVILSSGFDCTSGEKDLSPASVPVVLELIAHAGGDSIAQLQADPQAWGFQWGIKLDGPDDPVLPAGMNTLWIGISTSSKDFALHGLTPGLLYRIVFRAFGSGVNNFTGETEPIWHRAL